MYLKAVQWTFTKRMRRICEDVVESIEGHKRY